ncbi:MAG: transposase [Candidatus Omnitrophota bacterium]
MPRTARALLENACYHIINRGNQKQSIFLEKIDFEKYLELLKHYKRKYKFKLYAYCLMPNHIHLIIELRKTKDLAKIMQGITQTYTIWFNKKYIKVGRLWQNRFKSMLIQRDKYLLDCLKYIELNPVRAQMASSPTNYLWSSWQERMFTNNSSCLLDTPEIIK